MVAAPISNVSSSNIGANVTQVANIAPIDAQEAANVAAVELNHVLALLELLEGNDWTQPTDCTEWSVHEMTAHLAGACAAYASWKHFRRQMLFNPYMRKAKIKVDAINRRQLEDRAGKTSYELIEELHEVGPKAIRTRQNLPGILRNVRSDMGPPTGVMPIHYLMDIIYPRDQWMHRMDICRATDKKFVVTSDHDGRLLDLVMLDISHKSEINYPIQVNVTGVLSTHYRFGIGEPEAELDIDFFTLNRRASARMTADSALQTVRIHGDESVAERFLRDCEILY